MLSAIGQAREFFIVRNFQHSLTLASNASANYSGSPIYYLLTSSLTSKH
jgi:hypothetical protein